MLRRHPAVNWQPKNFLRASLSILTVSLTHSGRKRSKLVSWTSNFCSYQSNSLSPAPFQTLSLILTSQHAQQPLQNTNVVSHMCRKISFSPTPQCTLMQAMEDGWGGMITSLSRPFIPSSEPTHHPFQNPERTCFPAPGRPPACPNKSSVYRLASLAGTHGPRTRAVRKYPRQTI